ncbi:putative RNA-directed DNA polymerase [Rosa chinensis]|uniref:Putative RNA-directed DNA polymerase n=2 Tax=Rosa chinensis TaxID=74649 RepID=A0A2P6QM89_ROSCH|nr:putative RNA-directed DNA polymerase [Rosa chinensis]
MNSSMMQSEKQTIGHSVTTEFSVIAQRKQGHPPGFSGPSPRRLLGKPNPYANKRCIICGELGHSKERCYEVIGYPDWWDFTKKPRKNLGKAAVATIEEVYLDNASANVAQSGLKGKVTFNSIWIIDTGASDHMTNDPSLVKNLRRSPQDVVSTADGTPTPVTGEGSIALSDTLTLESVLVVPSLAYNLLSVGQIILALACIVTFYPSFCVFQNILTRRILGYGVRRGKLYYLDLTETGKKQKHLLGQANQINGVENAKEAVWLWHRRLGHLSFRYLKKLQPHLFSVVSDLDFRCDICELAKSHRISYSPSLNKSPVPFMKIHSDVWGPAKIPSLSGARYFVTFIDDCTRMTWVGWGASQSSLQRERGCEGNPRSIIDFDVFEDLENLEERFEGRNSETENAVSEESIVNSETENATAEQSAVVEQSIMNSETENATAEQSVVNSETKNATAEQSVVNSETEETTFLDSLNQNQDVSEAYTQDIPPSASPTEDPCQNCPPQVPLNFNESSGLESVEPRKSQRVTKGIPKKQYEPDIKAKAKYPIANFMSNHRISGSHALVVDQLSIVSIPSNVQDALTDPKWTKAMNEEMEALQKNATWELVPMPVGKKTVGCRWVFTVKLNADGTINRYKARLVAKGYTQRYGIDYEETFAPVAKINTVRILISLAANKDWPLHQFDVKNAFLNGNLEEEVYMDVPPGVKNYPSDVGKVCKLKKSLYGLKQSPRAWFGRFSKSMKAFGYRQSNSDHTLFIKRKNGKITALIVYVDDMIVTGDDPKEMNELQKYMSKEFEMKDLGQLKYFLGIEVARSKKGILLSQRKYVLDLLAEKGMLDCRPMETPIEMSHRLAIYPDQVPTDKGRYQRLVGRLIYLSHTRPDIAYAVSVVSQFMHCPSEEHMDVVFRILRYLKMAPDWAGDKTDRRSTSGYFTFVGGNLVTWRSKKQKVVARSSAEAEFRGMAHGVCEMLWIRNVLKDLGYKLKKPMDLHCDNTAAIEIAHNPVQHDRTKHVEVDRHFIKENLDRKVIRFPFVNSEEQLADVLTKGVSRKVFDSSVDKLGMIDIYAPT